MADKPTASEIASELEKVTGIEVNHSGDNHACLVKVMDEDAVGRFMAIRRKYSPRFSSVTRSTPIGTVMDAWID